MWAAAAFSLSSSTFVLLIKRRGEKVAVVWAHGEMANMSMWGIQGEERNASLVKHVVFCSLGGICLAGVGVQDRRSHIRAIPVRF